MNPSRSIHRIHCVPSIAIFHSPRISMEKYEQAHSKNPLKKKQHLSENRRNNRNSQNKVTRVGQKTIETNSQTKILGTRNNLCE